MKKVVLLRAEAEKKLEEGNLDSKAVAELMLEAQTIETNLEEVLEYHGLGLHLSVKDTSCLAWRHGINYLPDE